MIASCVKRCLRSVAASHAIAPSMAAVSRASFFRGKWQTIPTHFRCFSTSDPLPPWLHLPMEACVRDARFDQTFKILLGEEGAERRAISFLNAVLRLKEDGDRIKQIQFLDRSLYSLDNRAIHFDVRIQGLCSTYAGHTFRVEMQKFRVPSHMNRWIYYGCREITAIGERLHNAPTSQDKGVNQKTFYTGLTPVKVQRLLLLEASLRTCQPASKNIERMRPPSSYHIPQIRQSSSTTHHHKHVVEAIALAQGQHLHEGSDSRERAHALCQATHTCSPCYSKPQTPFTENKSQKHFNPQTLDREVHNSRNYRNPKLPTCIQKPRRSRESFPCSPNDGQHEALSPTRNNVNE